MFQKHTFSVGDIHLGLPPSRLSSVSGTSVSAPSVAGASVSAFLRLVAIRLGVIRLRAIRRGHPSWEHPSRGHPSRRHPSQGRPSLDWKGQDEWHRRMSLRWKAFKTEGPSVLAFHLRDIHLCLPSVPSVSGPSFKPSQSNTRDYFSRAIQTTSRDLFFKRIDSQNNYKTSINS